VLTGTVPVVDQRRLLTHLDELSRFGADDRGGVTRPGFGPADNAARRYLGRRAAALGLRASVDPAGNLFIRRPDARADRPVLLIGSHVDSVVYGGRYDGAYGVVAALEVLTVMAGWAPPLAYEPVVVAFANEEGAVFPYPFFGSKALVGALGPVDTVCDPSGRPLRRALREAGGDLDRLADAVWPAGRLGGFLELHVEQGPVLERAGVPIGVVEAITGRTILTAELRGRQNHAGTTPMDQRRDALVAAARAVLAVEDLARGRRVCAVATVGVLEVSPNVTNVVPGRVRLTAEVRDGRPQRLAAAEREVRRVLAGLADRVAVEVEVTMRTPPVATDARMSASLASAADALELPAMTMFSGAGHDAQIIAAKAPVGVAFVPSHDGISHAPQEHTDPDLLIAGANVLLGAVARLLTPAPAA
jgi:N-carbamoyl-L-amino-acid hydrolase